MGGDCGGGGGGGWWGSRSLVCAAAEGFGEGWEEGRGRGMGGMGGMGERGRRGYRSGGGVPGGGRLGRGIGVVDVCLCKWL